MAILGRENVSRRSTAVTAVVLAMLVLGMVATMQPVAAQEGGGGDGGDGGGSGDVGSSLGGALCDAGAGIILSAIFYLASIGLIYLAIVDIIKAVAQGGKDDPRQRAGSSAWSSAVKKLVGGIIIAAAPSILSAIGFSLLGCVSGFTILG